MCDAGSRHTAGHEPHDCASSHVIYVGRLHKQGQTKPTKSCGSLGASSRVYLGHADRVRGSLGGCVGRRFMMGTVQLVGVCLVFVCQSARRRLGRPGLIIGVLAVYCLFFFRFLIALSFPDRLMECLGTETKARQKMAAGSPFSG